MVADGGQRISLFVPSRLLMKIRMRNLEAEVVAEVGFLLRWVGGFFFFLFSMRDEMMFEAGFAAWGVLG